MKTSALLSALIGLALFAATAQANEATASKGGCMACHTMSKKLVGPAFKDISVKYKGSKEAVATLTTKVRKGGSGVWGPIPMSPNGTEKISDADLKTVVEWILKG